MSEQHSHLPHLSAFARQPLVFLTACTEKRTPMLAAEAVHEILRDVWVNAGERNGWIVGRYVIMPDHIHLFARQTMNGDALAVWMRAWRSYSAKQINLASGRTGALWQRDYFDRFVRNGESYSEKWNYVRQNPVRAGLVETADGWPHQGEVEFLRW